MELMKSTSKKSLLDPRTKMLLLTFVSIFVLGNAGGEHAMEFRYVLNYIPLILLLLSGRIKSFLKGFILYSIGYLLQFFVAPYIHGTLGFLLLAFMGIVLRFLPGILTGLYVVSTTTVSEFVCAMERMHIPQQVTIPLSVMFRFFPTVAEEASSINKAMAMRDIKFGGKKAFKMIEYRLIPMITCSVRIGQELSAASLTRGLGGPDKRTNICKIGFGWADFIVLLLLAGGLAFTILGAFKVI
ncbi:MAG: energy-coupling factor transporter transmembrane protein EcfT [Treponemataceae bacterium]|nr:energy-coupling factor transporter transmembrane protein EcfT [Treponemataceae bacterium]